jgi:hypothetical protein
MSEGKFGKLTGELGVVSDPITERAPHAVETRATCRSSARRLRPGKSHAHLRQYSSRSPWRASCDLLGLRELAEFDLRGRRSQQSQVTMSSLGRRDFGGDSGGPY